MGEKKGFVDTFFDGMDKIVDGAASVLSGVPEPESDDVIDAEFKEIKEEKSQPLLKSGVEKKEESKGKKEPRDIELKVRHISKREIGGVSIIVETPTHDLIRMLLEESQWQKLKDAIEWME